MNTYAIKIIEKPIIYDKVRDSLSLLYMKVHHNIDSTRPYITPKIIIIHRTDFSSFDKSFEEFKNPIIDIKRKMLYNSSMLNVGVHFLVDKDGTIYRLMDERKFGRHVIGLNYCSIGIENVGSRNYDFCLTEEQLNSNALLIEYLIKKYKTIEYVIPHFHYEYFRNSIYWRETDSSYFYIKNDPESDFVYNLNNKIKHLNIKTFFDE